MVHSSIGIDHYHALAILAIIPYIQLHEWIIFKKEPDYFSFKPLFFSYIDLNGIYFRW